MSRDTEPRTRLENDGCVLLEEVFSAADVERLRDALDEARGHRFTRTHQGQAFAIRNLLSASPTIRGFAGREPLLGHARALLDAAARPVVGLFFDKIPAANWSVPWHQDVTLPVARCVEVPGFGPWSMKLGVHHVQAPDDVLRRMVTLRIHLDDCGPASGALKVLPGTHRHGRLGPEDIARLRHEVTARTLSARPGDVLAMSPLVLHSSAPAEQPSHRRVIHLEYADVELPGGLEWYDA